MANTAANVIVGKPLATGGVLTGALSATLPTAATGTTAGFTAVGYISDDGVTQTIDTDTTDIVAWGGDTVRVVQTSHKVEYKFTLIETSSTSLSVYYGTDNVTGSAGVLTVKIKGGDLDHGKWVLEVKDGDQRVRVCIPDGQVTDRGDVVFKDDEAVGYEITLSCYPDSSGVKAYLYTDDDDSSSS